MGNLRPCLELQVVKFKSMTVRQKFGQNGNEALHGYFAPLWAALVGATYQIAQVDGSQKRLLIFTISLKL